jgi:hypothetical protein
MDNNYSLADLAAVKGDGMSGGGSLLFFLVILFLFMGGNGGWNNGGANLNNALNDQTSLLNQQQILMSSLNNNYETAQLINNQTNAMLQQNNTNLINAIQGFNQVNQKIDQLGYHLDQCCCEIKTQMLQNRLDDANAALVAAQGAISNANQSQYLLSMLGKYTPAGGTTTTP